MIENGGPVRTRTGNQTVMSGMASSDAAVDNKGVSALAEISATGNATDTARNTPASSLTIHELLSLQDQGAILNDEDEARISEYRHGR